MSKYLPMVLDAKNVSKFSRQNLSENSNFLGYCRELCLWLSAEVLPYWDISPYFTSSTKFRRSLAGISIKHVEYLLENGVSTLVDY